MEHIFKLVLPQPKINIQLASCGMYLLLDHLHIRVYNTLHKSNTATKYPLSSRILWHFIHT